MDKFKVAILGNRNDSYEPHFKMNRVFRDFQQIFPFDFEWVSTETLIDNPNAKLDNYQGIVAGSGPYKSKEGVINGIRYARVKNVPFFGTCSGFGYAVLEFGQSIFNLPEVFHPYENTELHANEIFLQQLNLCGVGMQTINFSPVKGTLTDQVYGSTVVVSEESHCVYGVNRKMVEIFKKEGLIVSGLNEEDEPKIMEYNRNNFFVITLFLPQMKSDIENPHPLITAFFQAVEQQ